MVKKISWCLVMVVSFLGLFGMSEDSLAKELNSGGFVDAIRFDKTELTDGELTSIHVTFSEKEHTSLKAGDVLTLSLPKELEGLVDSGDAPREIDLNGLGTVRVYKDRIVGVFNEKVNQLARVRGEFTFGVRVKNSEQNTVKEVPVNLGTSVSAQTIIVKGSSGGGEEREKPFFYKTGDLLGKSGQVRWFLCTNLNKSDLSNDIVLTDKSGSGQLLNKDSFTFTIDNYLGQSVISLEEFEQLGYGTVAFGADNSFVIRIYREQARLASFIIMYTTTITDAGKKQATFTNDCQIDYQVLYQKPIDEQVTHQVKNIFLDGTATGDENQEIKEAFEQEEMIVDESGELEELVPLVPEEVKESKEEELNITTEVHPETHVGEQVEVIEDESSELEEITPITPEQGKESKEEELNIASKEERPEVHIGEQVEVIEDESSELEEIAPINPEQAKESKEEELNIASKEERPEIHIDEQVVTIENEGDELEEIKPIKPETVEVTVTPKLEPAVTGKQVEVHQNKFINDNRVITDYIADEQRYKEGENNQSKGKKILLTDSKLVLGQSEAQLPKAGSTGSDAFVLAGLTLIAAVTGVYALKREKV